MQIKETIGDSFRGPVESQPRESVVVLVDSAGVALGAQRGFSSRVRNVGNRGLVTSRCVEIPLVGPDGEVSGVLHYSSPRSNSHLVIAPHKPERASEIVESAQFIVHDINNLLAVISSGLRLLERQDDAEDRKAIVGKLQETITRGAFLTRRLLDDARPQAEPIDGYVEGRRLAAIASSLDRALHPDITIRTEIAPDLWAFNADAEDLYFALLNLCRNSADAMPDGGVISVAARNINSTSDAAQGYVEIVVADDGEGMPAEILPQVFTPYFTTKPAGSGSGLGLPQVKRFAERRHGAVRIESGPSAGTLVRLFLPRVQAACLPSRIVGPEITYTPSLDGGVFHVINPATARTS
jgi:signal transduction histidine kinase